MKSFWQMFDAILYFSALGLGVAFIMAFSLSNAAAATKYHSKSKAFTFMIPDGWSVKSEPRDGFDVVLEQRGQDTKTPNGIVYLYVVPTTDDRWEEITKASKNKEMRIKGFVTVNGANCLHKEEIRKRNNGAIRSTFITCRFMLKKSKWRVVAFTFTLMMSNTLKHNAKLIPAYWRVLDTLRFHHTVTPLH